MPRSRPPAGWVVRLAPGADEDLPWPEQIRDRLRTAILEGAAPPGCAIPVDAVAETFAVSRIPVREALIGLVGEGLVDHQPRSGYVVAQLTRDELSQFYAVREALEAAALAVAVRLATPADDAEAEAAHDALTSVIVAGDARGHHRESRRFHMALAGPSRMHRLLHMFESAWNITEPLQPMSHVSAPQTGALHDDHRVMLDAFLARDADALLRASAEHYRRLQDIVDVLPGAAGLR